MQTEGESTQSLEAHRIAGLPQSFYYVSDFLSPAEETALLQKAPTAAIFIAQPLTNTF